MTMTDQEIVADFLTTEVGRKKLAETMAEALDLSPEQQRLLLKDAKPTAPPDWDRLEQLLSAQAASDPIAARCLANLRARRRLGLLT